MILRIPYAGRFVRSVENARFLRDVHADGCVNMVAIEDFEAATIHSALSRFYREAVRSWNQIVAAVALGGRK
jgi:hypothetical protein